MNRPEAWERQPGETTPAFAAFVAYRDLGESRSIVRAAEQVGKAKSSLRGWSVTNQWQPRTAAYDAYLDRQRRQRHLDLTRDAVDERWELSRKLRSKLDTAVEATDPAGWSPHGIARLLSAWQQLEDSVMVHTDPVRGVPEDLDEVDLTDLTDEEIRLRMQDLERELAMALDEYDGAVAGRPATAEEP